MDTNQHITLQMLLESLHDDFDHTERMHILQMLKDVETSDDALLGARAFLEDNNWDYKLLSNVMTKNGNRIANILIDQNKIESTKKTYLKYAAIFIPLAAIGYLSLKSSQSIDDFYKKDSGLQNLMSSTSQNEWNHLMDLYKSDQFNSAYDYSLELNKTKPMNDTAIYFKGILAYELKKYDLASVDFKLVETHQKSAFFYDSEFRLGFSLLKSGRKESAKNQFDKVWLNDQSPYSSEAKLILDTFFN